MDIINLLLVSTWRVNNENSDMKKNKNMKIRNLCNEKINAVVRAFDTEGQINNYCIKGATTYMARNEERRLMK